jgi:membrane-bound lytic murein transglycosylase MltF
MTMVSKLLHKTGRLPSPKAPSSPTRRAACVAVLTMAAGALAQSSTLRANSESTYELGSIHAQESDPYQAMLQRIGLHQRALDPDEEAFLARVSTRLPKFRAHFIAAEADTDIDWRLLAAIGYQESHWDPLAISPTGVRGLMMLTEDTARRMRVANRLDPEQSIRGGASYFALMYKMVPERIREPDRTWLALAAYNQGYGHLEDARILAQRLAMNADVWSDVRRALAKKSHPDYYPLTRLGYARGHEAVHFVGNVWKYYSLLCRLETPLMMAAVNTGS